MDKKKLGPCIACGQFPIEAARPRKRQIFPTREYSALEVVTVEKGEITEYWCPECSETLWG